MREIINRPEGSLTRPHTHTHRYKDGCTHNTLYRLDFLRQWQSLRIIQWTTGKGTLTQSNQILSKEIVISKPNIWVHCVVGYSTLSRMFIPVCNRKICKLCTACINSKSMYAIEITDSIYAWPTSRTKPKKSCKYTYSSHYNSESPVSHSTFAAVD